MEPNTTISIPPLQLLIKCLMFIFPAVLRVAQVNGDICYWFKNNRGKFCLNRVEHSGIGTAIYTKALGRGNRQGVDLK